MYTSRQIQIKNLVAQVDVAIQAQSLVDYDDPDGEIYLTVLGRIIKKIRNQIKELEA